MNFTFSVLRRAKIVRFVQNIKHAKICEKCQTMRKPSKFDGFRIIWHFSHIFGGHDLHRHAM